MVLRRMLDSNAIDRLFSEHADEQHHRSLLFSDLAVLVSGVVLGKHRSMNAGYKKMKEQLGVSVTAVSEKLQRVELPVVQQLVRHSYQQTVEICQVVLLTNLPRDKADAVAVSELYRTRWKIETAFGHMTVAMKWNRFRQPTSPQKFAQSSAAST